MSKMRNDGFKAMKHGKKGGVGRKKGDYDTRDDMFLNIEEQSEDFDDVRQEDGKVKLAVDQLPSGWRKKKGSRGVQLARSVGDKKNSHLRKKLDGLTTKDDYECTQYVEGFDVEKCPRYKYYLDLMNQGGLNVEAIKAAASNKERHAMAETLIVCGELNEVETTLNIGTALVNSAEVERVSALGDGYDEYLVASTPGVRSIWCGRSASFGTGPLIRGAPPTLKPPEPPRAAQKGGAMAERRDSSRAADSALAATTSPLVACEPPPRPRACPVHSDPKLLPKGASGKAGVCTCHYSVCIVCFWGEEGMLTLKSKTNDLVPEGYTAETIRQVRYLPDGIGIVLFSVAKTLDRLVHTSNTIQKICQK